MAMSSGDKRDIIEGLMFGFFVSLILASIIGAAVYTDMGNQRARYELEMEHIVNCKALSSNVDDYSSCLNDD